MGGGTSAENPHIEAIQDVKISEHMSMSDVSNIIRYTVKAGTETPVKQSGLNDAVAFDIESIKTVATENITIILEEATS